MIELKKAVEIAEDFVRGLYLKEEIRSMRVEEIGKSSDGKHWVITIGWPENALRQINPVLGAVHSDILATPRVYKQVFVDSETGAVTSMKIRDI